MTADLKAELAECRKQAEIFLAQRDKAEAQVRKLRAALKDCRDAMYADNPADGWKEIVDAADAALGTKR